MTAPIRQTSAEAYRAIQVCGFFARTAVEVYNALYAHGPLTQTETWKWIGKGKKDVYGPRFPVLVRAGVIQVTGRRPCTETGFNALIYDVTAVMPVKLVASALKPVYLYVTKRDGYFGRAYGTQETALHQAHPAHTVLKVKVVATIREALV